MANTRAPIRIQRKRVTGWRMPAGAVYVGRPTRFGNPYRVGENMPADVCVQFYREWLEGKRHNAGLPTADEIESLRGKDLACYCALDQPCHADVLLELANRPPVGTGPGFVRCSRCGNIEMNPLPLCPDLRRVGAVEK